MDKTIKVNWETSALGLFLKQVHSKDLCLFYIYRFSPASWRKIRGNIDSKIPAIFGARQNGQPITLSYLLFVTTSESISTSRFSSSSTDGRSLLVPLHYCAMLACGRTDSRAVAIPVDLVAVDSLPPRARLQLPLPFAIRRPHDERKHDTQLHPRNCGSSCS